MVNGGEHVVLLWDLASFFETVEPPLVAEATLLTPTSQNRPRLPIVATTLSVFGHAMTRIFRYGPQWSRCVTPQVSLATGCQSSPSLARAVLIDPLASADGAARFSLQHAPGVSYDSLNHVDDYSQEAGGDADGIFKTLTCAGRVFCRKAVAAKFRISSKSVVVSTSRELGQALQTFFRRELQVTIQVRSASQHLGHNRTNGQKILYSNMTKRFEAAKVRNRRVGILANHSWQAQNLFKSGTMPAASFSSTSLGMSTKLQDQLDSMAAASCGSAGLRPCHATIVWLRMGYVPSVHIVVTFLQEYVSVINDMQQADLDGLATAWRIESAHSYDSHDPWRHVTHSLAAVIAAVRQAGFTPTSYRQWSNHQDELTITSDPVHMADFFAKIRDALMQVVWDKASQRPDGHGLAQGKPCFDAVLKARRICLRNNRPDLARMVDRVAAGGATVGSKLTVNKKCIFCGCANDTARHRYHECQKALSGDISDDFAAEWLKKTSWVPAAARRHGYEPGCMWMRGILPFHWALGMTKATSDHDSFQFVTATNSGGADVYSDGAGQPRTVDAPDFAARVGAAAVAVDWGDDDEVRGIEACLTSVPGSQTIPRAETFGATRGAQLPAAPDGATYHVDATYVVNGAKQLRWAGEHSTPTLLQGRNADLWAAFRLVHAPGHDVTKIKAHTTLQQVAVGEVKFRDYAGNALADACAKAAAKMAALQPIVREFAGKHFAFALCTVMRCAVIEWRAELATKANEAWEMLRASSKLSCDAWASTSIEAMSQSGHQVMIKSNGMHVCMQCGISRKPAAWRAWVKQPCQNTATWEQGAKYKTKSHAAVMTGKPVAINGHALVKVAQGKVVCITCSAEGPFHDVAKAVCARAAGPVQADRFVAPFDGSFDAFRRGQQIQHKNQRAVNRSNRTRKEAVETIVAASVPVLTCNLPANESDLPPWHSRVDETHDRRYVGGYIFCNRCGAVGAVALSRSALFGQCQAKSAKAWIMPKGSQGRLHKLRAGKHPEKGTTRGATWPDGRSSDRVLGVHSYGGEPADRNTDHVDDNEDAVLLSATESEDEAAQEWPESAPPRETMAVLRNFMLEEAATAVKDEREFALDSMFRVFDKYSQSQLKRALAILSRHEATTDEITEIVSWRLLDSEYFTGWYTHVDRLIAGHDHGPRDGTLAAVALEALGAIGYMCEGLLRIVKYAAQALCLDTPAAGECLRREATSLVENEPEGSTAILKFLDKEWTSIVPTMHGDLAKHLEWTLCDVAEAAAAKTLERAATVAPALAEPTVPGHQARASSTASSSGAQICRACTDNGQAQASARAVSPTAKRPRVDA